MPLVSVILPIFNAEAFIEETLGYVVNQTLEDIEIICVDDGSTDCTADIIRKMMENDDRIHYYKQPNLGAGAARNNGIEHASGNYISFLDADDIFDSTMLEKAYSNALEKSADVVIFRSNLLDSYTNNLKKADWALRDNLIGSKDLFSPKDVSRYLFQFCNGWPWDKLFKRELIDRFNLRFQDTHFFNDSYFVFSALMVSDRISVMKECLATKRVNSGKEQISLNRSRYWQDFDDVVTELKIFIETKNLQTFKDSFENYALHVALVMIDTTTVYVKRHLELFIRDEYSEKIGFDSNNPSKYYDKQEYDRFKSILSGHDNGSYFNGDVVKVYYYGKENEVTDQFQYPDYIPILLAADENYSVQMYITLLSLISSRHSDTKYIIYMTVPSLFSNKMMNYFELFASSRPGVQLRFVVMGNLFSDISTTIAHITSPTYYRLVAADVIPYEKCIYTDVDLVVQKDLGELYNLDIGENYIAGVKAPVYHCHPDGNKDYCSSVGLESINQYVNAGVLVLNLEQLRKKDIRDKMIGLAYKELPSQDQDVFNLVSYNHIYFLDIKYNVMTKYSLTDYKRFNQLVMVFGLERSVDAYNNPTIIHYADKRKPWNDVSCLYSDIWWDYCSKSPFFKLMWGKMLLRQKTSNEGAIPGIVLSETVRNDLSKSLKNGEIARALAEKFDERAMDYYLLAIDNNDAVLSEFGSYLVKTVDEGDLPDVIANLSESHPKIPRCIGDIYRKGQGVKKDLNLAEKYYRLGANQGSVKCKEELLRILWQKNSDESNEEMIEVASSLAEIDDGNAMNILGRAYRLGRGVDKDLNIAAEWMRKASENGNRWSERELMEILWSIGTPESYAEMASIAPKLVSNGDMGATGYLGRMYRDGIGVEKNLETAAKWMRESSKYGNRWADKELLGILWSMGTRDSYLEIATIAPKIIKNGDMTAAAYLGRMYRDGCGVPKSKEVASYLLDKASGQVKWAKGECQKIGLKDYSLQALWKAGKYSEVVTISELFPTDSECMAYLGRAAIRGRGTEANPDKAAVLLKKASKDVPWASRCLVKVLWEQGTDESRSEAVSIAKELANDGDGYSMNILGRAYRDGVSVPVDLDKSAEWMRKASANGIGWADSELLMILWKTDTSESLEEMFNLALKLEDKGDARAVGMIGRAYLYGKGVQKDLVRARDYLERASECGIAWAKSELTSLNSQNEESVGDVDMMKSLWKSEDYDELFQKSTELAEQGDSEAMGYLARLYRDGKGTEADSVVAEGWMRKAASAGVTWSQNDLLDILWRSKRYDENFALAKEYYESGNKAAGAHLGRCYKTGKGVKQDLSEAEACLRAAVDDGVSWAKGELVEVLWMAERYDEMVPLAIKASDDGNIKACGYLGMAYRDGKGVPVDKSKAEGLLKRAASKKGPWNSSK